MQKQDLNLFIVASKVGSLSGAGRSLGLSAAVASKRLQNLEQTLGVRLFARTTRQLHLTDEGEQFLPHAQRILDEIEAAQTAVGGRALEPSGLLRITAPATFAPKHVTPALADFLGRYPKIELDVVLTDDQVDLVERGIDVGIRIASLADSSMIAKKLAPNSRLLVASPDYLAKRGTPEHPDELAQHDCLITNNAAIWRFDGKHGRFEIKVRGPLRTNSGNLVRQAALSGLGIAVKSSWDVYDAVLQGRLVPVLQEFGIDAPAAIWAVYPAGRFVPPKTRAFIDFFAERFADLPGNIDWASGEIQQVVPKPDSTDAP